MMSINFFAPFFMLVSGLPAMLPERSSTSTMSVGVLLMSGEADSASVTFKEPEQSIRLDADGLIRVIQSHCHFSFDVLGTGWPWYSICAAGSAGIRFCAEDSLGVLFSACGQEERRSVFVSTQQLFVCASQPFPQKPKRGLASGRIDREEGLCYSIFGRIKPPRN